jgi:hypothetical protein
MIIAVTPLLMDHKTFSQIEAGDPLPPGEIILIDDSERVLIGPDTVQGNQHNLRIGFPFENIEVLSETSPRNAELFGLHIRNQTTEDFYLPAMIANAVGNTPIMVSDYDGGLLSPLTFSGDNISATVEYHAYNDLTAAPLQSGTLRILATSETIKFSDRSSSTFIPMANTVTFNAVFDNNGDVLIQAMNPLPTTTLFLRLRKVAITP